MMMISLTFLTSNLLVWWSILILTTLVFLTMVKSNLESYSMIKYFMMQEIASLTMGVMILFQLPIFLISVMIMAKVALAPFHFWVVSAIQSLQGWSFVWVVTYQKMPGLLMLSQILDSKGLVLLMIGSIFCSLQMMITVKAKSIVLLSTTVTSSWVIMTSPDKFSSTIFLLVYFISMSMLMNEIQSEQNMPVEGIFTIVLMSFPLTVMFMFKIAIILISVNFNDPLVLLFLASTLGASLAYMEVLKSYVTTRETHLMFKRNQTLITLAPLVTLLMMF